MKKKKASKSDFSVLINGRSVESGLTWLSALRKAKKESEAHRTAAVVVKKEGKPISTRYRNGKKGSY